MGIGVMSKTKWVLLLMAVSLIVGTAARADESYKGPVQLDDGMYTEPWFLESFLDLKEDLTTAASEGKRFVVMWELKGCPYCKETHFKNFADAGIRNFVRPRFEVLQLNVQGSRMVTDFDGETLEERALAAKYGVRFTPTLQFFPADATDIGSKKPREREVARMPGYFRPPHFLAMFRYVHERAYESENFRGYLKRVGSGSG